MRSSDSIKGMLSDKKIQKNLKISLFGLTSVVLLMSIHPFLVSSFGMITGQYAVLKLWKELVLVVVLSSMFFIAYNNKKFRKVITSNRINQYIVLFTVLSVVMAAITITAGQTEAAIAGLVFNLRFFVIFVAFQLAYLLTTKQYTQLKQQLITFFLYTSIAVALFGILQVTLLPKDFLVPFGYDGVLAPPAYTTVDDNDNALRAFSTMWGPNMLGSYLLLPLALFTVNIFRKKQLFFSIFGFSVSLLAIAMTYSRSALLAAIVVVFVVAAIFLKERIKRHLFALGILSIISCVVLIALSTTPFVRLYVFHSSPGDSSIIEGSTKDHFVAMQENAVDAISHPLGQGTGSAGPASFYLENEKPKIAENYFIQIAQEIGILGLMLFIAISFFVGLTLFRQSLNDNDSLATALFASFVGINVINLFLHGWTDDPTSIVWWGFAAIAMTPYIFENIKSHSKIAKIKH